MLTRSNPSGVEACLFRMPARGGRAIWQITNRCNYRCPYCIFGSGAGNSASELSCAEALRVLHELRQWGCCALKITGGEPLMRRDILEIAQRAAGFGWEVDISTNAALITPALAGRIAGAGLAMMHVSLDGPDAAAHEAARGRGTFLPTVRGLNALVAAGVRVRIGCVIFRETETRLEEMVRYSCSQGAAEIVFSLMEPAGRLPVTSPLLAARPLTSTAAEIEALAEAFQGRIAVHHNLRAAGCNGCGAGCPGGRRFLFIDSLGRMAPCTWVAERMPRYRSRDTLKHRTLREILASPPLRTYSQMCAAAGGAH